ncbi:hypothetical protein [Nostoc sp.]|uniref:hypothetical protein n=1 Tax=Nostoc sp. TaxID=1180 RepID=UPI002FFBF5D4
MLAESTEMRKQSSILRKQYAFLLAEPTEMSARHTQTRKQLSFIVKIKSNGKTATYQTANW